MLLTSMLLLACSLQEKLLYYPDRRVPSDSELQTSGLRFWPAGREGYRGFIIMPKGRAKGTVVVLHGNGATGADRTYYLEPFGRLGYRVLLAEYPGYGGREGKLGEESFVHDARETIRLAAQRYPGPLYVLGESLGGAVAAAAVMDAGVAVAGMILVTPWETLEAVAGEKFLLLPVGLFLTDRYDTVANLRNFQGAVAVVAAERDYIIPPRHARELYRTFAGRKRMWTIPGAGHNDWPSLITDTVWQEVIAFVSGG